MREHLQFYIDGRWVDPLRPNPFDVENPATERYVNDADYRAKATPLLGLPGQDATLLSAGPDWIAYRHQRNDYEQLRRAEYRASLARAYDDFVRSDALTEKVFRVLQRASGITTIPLSAIGRASR